MCVVCFVYVCLSLYFLSPSACLSISLSVLSVCPSIYLDVCLSVCLFCLSANALCLQRRAYHESRDDGGRGRAQAAAVGNAVEAIVGQRRHGLAGDLKGQLHAWWQRGEEGTKGGRRDTTAPFNGESVCVTSETCSSGERVWRGAGGIR